MKTIDKRCKWTKEGTEQLILYYNQETLFKDMVLFLNKTSGSISRKLDILRQKGIINTRRKITILKNRIDEIQQLINSGLSMRKTATKLCVPYTSLRAFCSKNNISSMKCIMTPWLKEEINKLKDMLKTQLTFEEMGQLLGKTRGQINSQVRRLNLKSSRPKNNKKYNDYKELRGGFFKNIERNADARNILFQISIKQVWDLFVKQDRKCALTGVILTFQTKPSIPDGTASLDRINSDIPYIKDNVQWIHKDINKMKMEFNQDYFIKMCEIVTDYQRNK